MRRNLPFLFTALFGGLTLVGLLFAPQLADLLLGWGAFLAAVALIFGVGNLFLVHGRRLANGRNRYSFFLLLGLVAVTGLALSDSQGMTENGVDFLFTGILLPLEAALASLVAFFLLFAAFRLLNQQRSGWSLLFVATAVIVLLGSVPLPVALTDVIGDSIGWLRDYISLIFVTAGMRGILIGVALGALTISLRLLAGWERPYSK